MVALRDRAGPTYEKSSLKLSINNYQLIIINYQLSIINYQLSIINFYSAIFARLNVVLIQIPLNLR